jgi:thiol-disulfide isomerase/thioredoxin
MLAASGGLPSISEQSLPEVLSGYRGQVVVLNFWATWCRPCREEFPHLVRLHRELADRGLTVMVVSMDEEEDAAAAAAFLQKQGADFPSYIRGFEDFGRFVDAVDPQWSGALPSTFIFRRDGELYQRYVGEVTWEQLVAAVTPLLEQP